MNGFAGKLHGGCPAAFHDNALDENILANGEILAAPGFMKETGDDGGPAGVQLGELIVADAILLAAVEIPVVGNSKLSSRLEEGLANGQWGHGI